ncbi:putative GNAT superfamily acetyltransferase [Scopulibacillus darangshiensis]|uniref:Putative GNAT superfamily acetyltransferase n=1 Tax=Scopulibacillus darangshiensis TaxID=442528 RepID=A0A4R2NID9_9BACL|nr:GNAT family N-acetyltransferase [Scopulibacillus darangshiensis]TCP21171.1 putative GNAT superfamily acetyltransferase [Scopulibacillus darangshiensis]
MSHKDTIITRCLDSVEELDKVRELESIIWSRSESTPSHQTLTAVKNGGLVIGAFAEDKQLIGFQYSFPGFDGNNVYLCSPILGIHPEFRKLGIGEKLKRRQKEEAIKKGYDLIVWTYDPLETVNGHLNLHKLGAVCSTYIENCYGEMDDGLNQGMPSDRFLVEWRTRDDRKTRKNNDEHRINEDFSVIKTAHIDGYPEPIDIDLTKSRETGSLLVPVPSNFQKLKKGRLDLALEWRKNTRQVFSHYFKNGWTAIDLVRHPSDATLYCYVLSYT